MQLFDGHVSANNFKQCSCENGGFAGPAEGQGEAYGILVR